MGGIISFIANFAVSVALTALAVLSPPEAPFWKWLLWIGIAVSVACACVWVVERFWLGRNEFLLYGMWFGIALTIFFGIAFWSEPSDVPGKMTQNEPLQGRYAIIRINPSVIDAQINWSDQDIQLAMPGNISPFAINIKNIGNDKAIDIKVGFSLSISPDDLLRELATSKIFPFYQLKGKRLSVSTQFGSSWNRIENPILGENLRRLDVLETGDEKRIIYPPEISNQILLWILSKSYTQEQNSDKMRPDFNEIGTPQFAEKLQEISLQKVITLPEVTITTSWNDLSGKTHSEGHTIKGIYQGGGTGWVNDKDRKYLEGGYGMISYEDPNNPSEGFYNVIKNQKEDAS